MKRTIILLSLFCITLPQGALAFYDTPSALLRAAEFDGRSRRFSMEMHGNMAHATYVSLWVNGMAEGLTPQTLKAKMTATLDIHENGSTLRSKFEALVHDHTVYLRLHDMTDTSLLRIAMPEADKLKGKWIAIPVDEAQLQASDTQQIRELIAPFQTQDNNLDVEEMARIGQSVLDAMLHMERAKYPGGYAYFLSAKPDLLKQIIRTSATLGILDGDPEAIIAGLEQNPNAAALQNALNEHMNLSIKIDTDSEGTFQFGRFAFDVDMDEFALHGKGETIVQGTVPVYIEVPADAMTMDSLMQVLSPMIPEDNNWMLEDQTDAKTELERWNQHQGYDPQNPHCDAPRGTPEHLLQVRKGLCTLDDWTRFHPRYK